MPRNSPMLKQLLQDYEKKCAAAMTVVKKKFDQAIAYIRELEEDLD